MKYRSRIRMDWLNARHTILGAMALVGMLVGVDKSGAQTVNDCLASPNIVTHLLQPVYHRVRAAIPEKVSLSQSHVLWRQSGNARDVYYVPAGFPRPAHTKRAKLKASGAVIDFVALPGSSAGSDSVVFYSTLQGIHRAELPGNSGRLVLSPQRPGYAMTELAVHESDRMVWVEDKDIWTSASLGAGAWSAGVAVTRTPGRERCPDVFGPHLVWEDATYGLIKHALVSNVSHAVSIDEGRNPSVFGDYVVYEKDIASPNSACEWSTHSQLWGFGPLNDPTARAFPLMPYSVCGASDCFEPILTESQVVFGCRFRVGAKTILGVIPFRTPSDPKVTTIEELTDDFVDSFKGVHRVRGASVLRVAFRDGRGGDALSLFQH